MLIFEGPDGGGKTTLLNSFILQYDIPVAPRVVSKDAEAMVDLQQWVDENIEAGFQSIAFDRHRLISETIYGPILRTNAQPGFNKMSWLAPRMRRFYELRPIIIYCLPPFEQVWKNVHGDLDNRAVESKIEAIYSAYVARAALDYSLGEAEVHIWDYTASLNIGGNPTWFSDIARRLKLNERTFA